jgi:SAM-dependent methyltransferase
MKGNKIEKLSSIAQKANYEAGFNARLMDFRYQTIKSFLKGGRGLEVGSADGLMTKRLLNHFEELHVVEPVAQYAVNLKKLSGVVIHNCLFEDFEPDVKFDTVIMCHVLEHVDNPVELLQKAKDVVKDNGRVIVTVPNADSIHRHIGIKMGLLERLDQLNETDLKIDHKRVYFLKGLKEHVEEGGLRIVKKLGFFVKFLSNDQMERLDERLIQALYEISDNFKNHCSSIGYVCVKKN